MLVKHQVLEETKHKEQFKDTTCSSSQTCQNTMEHQFLESNHKEQSTKKPLRKGISMIGNSHFKPIGTSNFINGQATTKHICFSMTQAIKE